MTESQRNICRIILTAVLLLCIIAAISTHLEAQTTVDSATQHAVLEHRSNGDISIQAQGPWSLEQVIATLRREYGWIVDYEESIPASSNLVRRSDGRFALRSRVLSFSTPAPVIGSLADEQATLQALVAQLNSADYARYKILNTTPTRFDVTTPTMAGAVVPLDTRITLPRGSRSISEAIQEILDAIQAKIGYSIVRGGLAVSELDRASITFDSSSEVPARTLLAEALDAAHEERVWILTYEPSTASFVLGIEPAVRMIRTSSGQLEAKGIVRQKVQ